MVAHWRRVREAGWRRSAAVNTVGAVATGVVAVIIGSTKFIEGAWISMGLMVLLVMIMWRIRSHYAEASLPRQFDALVWLDETQAVTPLGAEWSGRSDAETWPFGL